MRRSSKIQNKQKRMKIKKQFIKKDRIVKKYEIKTFIIKNIEENIQKLKDIIERDKNTSGITDIKHYYQLDFLYQQYGFKKQHKKLFHIIKKLYPDDSHTDFLIGFSEFIKGNNIIAMIYFDKARKKGYNLPIVFICCGNISDRLGDLESAKEFYKKAIKIDNENEIAYYNLAANNSKRGNLSIAEKYCFKSAFLNPTYRKAYMGFVSFITNSKFETSKYQLGRIGLVLDPTNSKFEQIIQLIKIKQNDFERLISMPTNDINKMLQKLEELWSNFLLPMNSFE